MSNKQNETLVQILWGEYQRLQNIWDGSDLRIEQQIHYVAGHLKDLGVDVDKLINERDRIRGEK